MAHAVKTDRIEEIRQTEKILLERHPALADVIRPFAGLFREKARLVKDLKEGFHGDLFELHPSNTPPALQVENFPASAAGPAARRMLEAVKAFFPALASDLSRLETRMDKIDLSQLLRNYLEKGTEAAAECAEGLDVPAGGLEMVTRLCLSALLEAMVPEKRTDIQASQAHCPVCGSLPSISYLDLPPENQSEFLTGGGGMKFFHCSLCGHDFKTHRHLCPVCQTREPEHLRYYAADGESGERLDACLNCNTYLPCIDLRKAEGLADMDTAATGLLHIEILAREKGFHPIAWTPWNRIE